MEMDQMNREQIMDWMKKQSGLTANTQNAIYLERFAAIVAIAEREECANVCEEIRVIVDGNHPWTALHVQDKCVKAIRARGTA